MRVKGDNVHQLPPPRANRKNPERDTAVRYRAVPSAFVRRGTNGDVLIPLWATTGGQGHGDAGLLPYLDALEKRIARLERDESVSLGRAAPIEAASPMLPQSEEQVTQTMVNAVSIPGNEAEQLTLPDVAQVIQPDTVLLLPAPQKMLNLVKMPVQPASNDEAVPKAAPLPVEKPDGITMEWLWDQFHMSDMDVFRAVDAVFQARNKASLKKHGKTYDEIRIERLIKRKGVVAPGSSAWHPALDSKYMAWVAKLPQLIEERKIRVVAERLAWKKSKATSPEADIVRIKRAELARKLEIQGGLDVVKLERKEKFSSVDRLAHEPVVERSSALELRAYGLMARDGLDWLRSKVGLSIPERVVERGNVGWFLDDVKWLAFAELFPVSLPHPADTMLKEAMQSSESVSQAELVRRYRRAGIGH